MRHEKVTALAIAVSLATSSALNILPRHEGRPSVVGLNIQRKSVADPVRRDALRKRQKTVSQNLDNEQALYYANVSVGTPSQNMRLHIDTGSSDMWVNTPKSQICSFSGDFCSSVGSYNPNSSSTYHYVNGLFNLSYEDGSGASGDYVTDNVGIGQVVLEGMQFGIGYDASTPEAVLGIGYVDNEAQTGGNGQTYPNMPQAMVNGGLIQSNAYSMWLDDLEASTGSILFGGIDTNKYTGSLQTLPSQANNNQHTHSIVTLSGLEITADGQISNLSSSLPVPVILDTGSSITYLPDSLAQDIFDKFSIQYDSQQEAGYASCALANKNTSVDFVFSSITISVSIKELVINPNDADNGDGNTFGSEDSLCLFGITNAGNEAAVLGDTFLRSAYVVYDLDSNQVAMAQTNFDSNTTDVVEIGTGTSGIPDATAVASPVQAGITNTAGSGNGQPGLTVHSGSVFAARPAQSLSLVVALVFLFFCI